MRRWLGACKPAHEGLPQHDDVQAVTTPEAREERAGYRADVDGLRAVAVSAVVVYHMSHSWLPGGFVGVDVFFVISGFVVTGSLLRTPGPGVRDVMLSFYARRVRRLAPALLLTVLTAALGMSMLVPPASDELPRYYVSAQLSLLGWVNNYYAALDDVGYWNEGPATLEFDPFTHMWSLGVEEQFYLLFPAIIACAYRGAASAGPGAGLRAALRSPVAPLCLCLCLSLLASALLSARAPQLAFYLLPSRFWQLMIEPPGVSERAATPCFDPSLAGQYWHKLYGNEKNTKTALTANEPCFDSPRVECLKPARAGEADVLAPEATYRPFGVEGAEAEAGADGGGVRLGHAKAIFVLGDSKAGAIMPAVRAAAEGRMSVAVNASWGGTWRWPPKAVLEALRANVRPGDVVLLANQQGQYELDILDRTLLPLLRNREASLVLLSDNAKLSRPPATCVAQWSLCETDPHSFDAYDSQAAAIAASRQRVYAFSQAALWTDGALVPGTPYCGYSDSIHLNPLGALYLAPFLCSALDSWGLFGGAPPSSPQTPQLLASPPASCEREVTVAGDDVVRTGAWEANELFGSPYLHDGNHTKGPRLEWPAPSGTYEVFFAWPSHAECAPAVALTLGAPTLRPPTYLGPPTQLPPTGSPPVVVVDERGRHEGKTTMSWATAALGLHTFSPGDVVTLHTAGTRGYVTAGAHEAVTFVAPCAE